MAIPFTQYLMPDGRPREVSINLDPETEAKAREIIAAGFRFEIEMLRDYSTISMTIADPRLDEDVAIKLCDNGPAVPKAVAKLINDFRIPAITG